MAAAVTDSEEAAADAAPGREEAEEEEVAAGSVLTSMGAAAAVATGTPPFAETRTVGAAVVRGPEVVAADPVAAAEVWLESDMLQTRGIG